MNPATLRDVFETNKVDLSKDQRKILKCFLTNDNMLRLAALCLYKLIDEPGQTADYYRDEIRSYCFRFGYSLPPGVHKTLSMLNNVATTLQDQVNMLRMVRELLTYSTQIPFRNNKYLEAVTVHDPEALRVVRNLPVIVRNKVFTLKDAHSMAGKPGGGDFKLSIGSYITMARKLAKVYPRFLECKSILGYLGYDAAPENESNFTWAALQIAEMANCDCGDTSEIEAGFIAASEIRKYHKGLNLTATGQTIEVQNLASLFKSGKVVFDQAALEDKNTVAGSLADMTRVGGDVSDLPKEEAIYEDVDSLF